jgi:integrase
MRFTDTWKAEDFPKLPTNGKKDQLVPHETVPGFYFRVRNTGHRSWVVQTRIKGRTRKPMNIQFEKAKPLVARKAAEKCLAEIVMGGDPSARKTQERRREALTMLSVAKDFIADKKNPGKGVRPRRPSTLAELERYLTNPMYFGSLHRAGINTIELKDVAAAVRRIKNGSGAVCAGRARGCLSAMYSWAMGEGIADRNPVVGSNKPEQPGPRRRVLDASEIAAVWHAAGNSEFGTIVKLLLLTAQRRGEIGGLRWSEIKDDNTIELPGERTKNHEPHKLPLPFLALEVIAKIPRTSRDVIFGERKGKGYTRWDASKKELDERLGGKMKEPWTLHDLRRTFSTRAGDDLGVLPHAIDCCLNHKRPGVAGVYNWAKYAADMRKAMELWGEHIRKITGGGGKLLPFVAPVTA